MYHSISEPDEPLGPYYVTNTRPSIFRSHLQFLKDHGYAGVSLAAGLAWLEASTCPRTNQLSGLNSQLSTLDLQPVVLTFDDGFADFYTTAAPLLREFGCTATMYAPTDLIDLARGTFNDRPCMTWSEIRELAHAGIEFGSHTRSHPKLYQLGWSEIESELAISKIRLQEMLGVGVAAFAYPYAFPQADRQFVARFCELLQQLGYQSCATTIIGRMSPMPSPFLLPRLPVNSFDDNRLFAAKLAGHYDWLAVPQAAVKHLKQLRSALRFPRKSASDLGRDSALRAPVCEKGTPSRLP